MSVELTDVRSGESSCCGAPVYLGGLCSDCGEHCSDVSLECPLGLCDGSGEITTMEPVYPNEPHLAPIGSQVCPCQRKEDKRD